MAGIGFELKKLFSKKGVLATIRAYGYAGMVCAGPMLLGVALLLGVLLLAYYYGTARSDRELLISMITYALLFSLSVTSIFSMLTTRYTADTIFEQSEERVLPSFFGSLAVMLVLGGTGYGIFLYFSGVELVYQVLSLWFFLTLLVTWTEVNYLTAVKEYKSIIKVFFVAIVTVFALALVLIYTTPLPIITSLFIAVNIGYGLMAVWYFALIYDYFPEGFGASLYFLKWGDKYPHLWGIGFFVTAGLFGHLVIMWSSPLGVQIKGLFYGAPEYDVSALIAFLSILVTTVNFVTSVEVRFYPEYRTYFTLFNESGSISDIENIEKGMLDVLKDELLYLCQKQAFTTILFVVIGSILLPRLPLGFNSDMLGMFRVLCVGYALYAIGNSVMLILLYFSDNYGAFWCSLGFALFTNIATYIFKFLPAEFYGFGFVIGSALFCIISFIRLEKYIAKLKYHVLAEQPVFAVQPNYWMTRLVNRLDVRAQGKQQRRKIAYQKRTEAKHGLEQ